ncbi:glutamyl-tRNA amidotransferase [[Mycoplasma] falconis]|uniref:Glutamyl-tRNA amidotransferase n=1 Tax=[Mycoplasma] falconis TaxID=92403 RepID=A0A501XC48_9BACT|nr:glutamyl-tRNA amidotransferase [[Mycoplasma] falconis]TPE58082.1 glutamyl-tRNA amidotransferase [[Mycoplasma] falconis]
MDDKELKQLANNLLFEPNEEVLTLAKKLLGSIDKELLELENFDLSYLKAMSHVNEKPLAFEKLRLDEIDESFILDKKSILENAKEHDNDFVIIKKVINEN